MFKFSACFIAACALGAVGSLQVPVRVDYETPAKTFNVTGNFRDCVDLHRSGHKESGIYSIRQKPTGGKKQEVLTTTVRCVQTETGSWTVAQQRIAGNIGFDVSWLSYQQGFGNVNQDYWIGLDVMHGLTQRNDRWLQINLHDWSGYVYWAAYKQFFVGPSSDMYRLSVSQFYGNVTHDDFSYGNGLQFATWDRPDRSGCATNQRAGWWYNYCAYALLNGRYYRGGYYPEPPNHFWNGVYWQSLRGYNYSMKYVSMLVGLPNVGDVAENNGTSPAGMARHKGH